MPLIATTQPNMVSGVSHQAQALRQAAQAQEQINGMSSLVQGLQKRPPSLYVGKVIAGSFAPGSVLGHTINRDSTEQYKVTFLNGQVRVFDLNGTARSVSYPHGSAYIASTAPRHDLRAVTIADFTFIVNRSIIPVMGSAMSRAYTNAALVWVTQGAYNTTYNVVINGTTYTRATSAAAPDAQTTDIISHLATSIGSGPGSAFTVTASDNAYLLIQRNDGAAFTCTVSDSASNTAMAVISTSGVSDVSTLPAYAPHGMQATITPNVGTNDGTSGTAAGTYYVVFQVAGNAFPTALSTTIRGTGQWVESLGYGIKSQLDPTTMPHTLVRNPDGSFTFDQATFADRLVGDDTSNSAPSFVGTSINNVVFWRNRLIFLADQNTVGSEAGQFFNFWRTTAAQVLDSDPIDVSASGGSVNTLYNSYPFYDQLLLFSDQKQFSLSTNTDTLTSKTASIQQTTSYKTLPDCAPIGSGRSIYFPFSRGAFSGLMEYYIQEYTTQYMAVDVTEEVADYLTGNLVHLTASENEQIMVGITDGYNTGVFVYKFFYQAYTKLQSAWSRWDFGPNAVIHDAEFIDAKLHLLIGRPDGIYIETINTETGFTDPASGYATLLDRRVSDTQCTSAYDPDTDTTTFTIPYPADPGRMFQAVTRFTSPQVGRGGGIILSSGGQSTNTITVNGNQTTQPIWIGEVYSLEYDLSRAYVRETSSGGKVVIATGIMQVRRGFLSYSAAHYFRVLVTPKWRDTYTYIYTGHNLGAAGNSIIGASELQDGVFRFPIQAKNDEVTITIINDSPFPSNFVTIDYESMYESKSRRANG